MKPAETVKCPKDPENNYFVETCQTIFLKTGFRHWCKTCQYFADSGDQESPPMAENDKEAS